LSEHTAVQPGPLYLVPTPIDVAASSLLPEKTLHIIIGLHHFIVENPRTARAFLKAAGHPVPLRDLCFGVLNEHTGAGEIAELLQPARSGSPTGLLSDAGCPAVADPGAILVRRAHAAGIKVIPLVGPSAILLALMASGLNGQRFRFHGYLPAEAQACCQRLVELERLSRTDDCTQIFIEAPYRNPALLERIFSSCKEDTLLCLATDITGPAETIRTMPVSEWRVNTPVLLRRPTVFLLYRGSI